MKNSNVDDQQPQTQPKAKVDEPNKRQRNQLNSTDASDGPSEAEARVGKASASGFVEDDEGNDVLLLGNENRRLKLHKFKGQVLIDIRETYVKDGKSLPGKKGISLKPEQLQVILDHAEQISAAVEALKAK